MSDMRVGAGMIVPLLRTGTREATTSASTESVYDLDAVPMPKAAESDSKQRLTPAELEELRKLVEKLIGETTLNEILRMMAVHEVAMQDKTTPHAAPVMLTAGGPSGTLGSALMVAGVDTTMAQALGASHDQDETVRLKLLFDKLKVMMEEKSGKSGRESMPTVPLQV